MPSIEFRSVRKVYPDGTEAVRDLALTIRDREFLCILGPSGCGKSSTLRMLAGLEQISSGEILVDGVRINEVPARNRDMAMVFENYALYPHLDVFHNISMPLLARKTSKAEIRRRVEEIGDLLRLREQMRQYPRTLSGGQRQRVALGRALIREPRTFLMDEPLGHLEAYLRVELRSEIRRLHEQRKATTVYITHDQEEAGAVADRIVVMERGCVQQSGSLVDLIDAPVNRFVASFVGEWPINFLPATIGCVGGKPTVRVGGADVELTQAQIASVAGAKSEPLELGVRPDDVQLAPMGAENGLMGHVVVTEPQGERAVVVVDTSVGRVNAVAEINRAPAVGAPVAIVLPSDRIHLFGTDGGNLFGGLGSSTGIAA
jgi:multiple sugar transport system ATP-binding protein